MILCLFGAALVPMHDGGDFGKKVWVSSGTWNLHKVFFFLQLGKCIVHSPMLSVMPLRGN